MSELTLTLLRLGYLALLWLLVLSIVAVIRRDLSGRGRAAGVAASALPAHPVQSAPVAAAPGPTAAAASPSARPRAAPAPAPTPPAGPAARTLVVTDGPLRGTTLPLGRAPVLLGRAPECTLVLEDDYVSGRHARFRERDGAWVLEDLGSTNGTFLGTARIDAPTVVDPGTPVRIGRTVLELRR